MIRSTPVTDSIVRMFLPSLPIILPFISSLGKSTTVTVCSSTTSLAYFCMLSTNIDLDFLSTSSFASASFSFMYAAISSVIESSTFFITNSLAFSLVYPLIFSKSSNCSCFNFSTFASCS